MILDFKGYIYIYIVTRVELDSQGNHRLFGTKNTVKGITYKTTSNLPCRNHKKKKQKSNICVREEPQTD